MKKPTSKTISCGQLVAGIAAVMLGLTFHAGTAHARYSTTEELNSTYDGNEYPRSNPTFNNDDHSAYDWNQSARDYTYDGNEYPTTASTFNRDDHSAYNWNQNTHNDKRRYYNLDQEVSATLQRCRNLFASCAETTRDAAGILVFPSVIKADLIIGGAGGKGALVENGRITGYYSIGAATAGLQAGVDNSSQIYVFRTQNALQNLKRSSEWRIGATAGVTVVTADANASSLSGNILTYVFDSEGLHAGIALDVLNVWRTDRPRPRHQY